MTKAVNVASVGSPGVSLGFKNRIINGDMRIDQRNNGSSVTPTSGSDTYIVDRFSIYASQASKLTAQQNAGSVTPPVGFTKYLGITSSSAYSILSTDWFTLRQAVEGFNCADLSWGTANAASITISFWVRSSLTGTFGGSLRNSAATRSYPFTYTINSTNTWEQKSITIAGDTSGTWATDNTAGITVFWGLGVGSSNSGTAGSWASASYGSATGATSVVGTSGATFYITGVQLEVGTTATNFEVRDYGRELKMCQRYYTKTGYCLMGYSVVNAGAYGFNCISFPTAMRATPTMAIGSQQDGGTYSSLGFDRGDTNGVRLQWATASGFASFAGYTANAEL